MMCWQVLLPLLGQRKKLNLKQIPILDSVFTQINSSLDVELEIRISKLDVEAMCAQICTSQKCEADSSLANSRTILAHK